MAGRCPFFYFYVMALDRSVVVPASVGTSVLTGGWTLLQSMALIPFEQSQRCMANPTFVGLFILHSGADLNDLTFFSAIRVLSAVHEQIHYQL